MSQDVSRYLKEHPTEVQEFQCLHPTFVKWVRGVPRLAPPFLSSVRTALFLVAKVDHAVIRHCHLHVGFQWISQVQDGSGWYRYPVLLLFSRNRPFLQLRFWLFLFGLASDLSETQLISGELHWS